jgi:hypothetical protein
VDNPSWRAADRQRYAEQGMKALFDEVLQRFPELAAQVNEGDEDLPYVVVGYIAEWLLSVELDSATIQRVVDFDRWCMQQPRGQTAADDILTIEVIGLQEELFRHDKLLPVVTKLISREVLQANKEYFSQWVGADRYQAAWRLACGNA